MLGAGGESSGLDYATASRAFFVMPGRSWLRGTFLICILWTTSQFVVASLPELVRDFYSTPSSSGSSAAIGAANILSRLGFMPSPLLFDESALRLSVALACLLQLSFAAALAVCCRVHVREMEQLSALEVLHDERVNQVPRPRFVPRPRVPAPHPHRSASRSACGAALPNPDTWPACICPILTLASMHLPNPDTWPALANPDSRSSLLGPSTRPCDPTPSATTRASSRARAAAVCA